MRPFASVRARAQRVALWLAFAATPLAGCAHLPWRHHIAAAPHAPRAVATRASAGPATHAAPADPYALADHHIACDSLVLAESELRALLDRDPDDAAALSRLSLLLYRAGRHEEAVARLAPLRTRPDAFRSGARRALLAGMALHEDALGRASEAREALAAAGATGDDDAGSAAVYLALRGDAPDSADLLARDAVRRDARSAANQNNLGITRLRAGDLEGARRAFTIALSRDPSLPGPYYNLAILEKYYVFDDTAAARWFSAYWSRSHDDPDSLRAAFPADLAGVPVDGRP